MFVLLAIYLSAKTDTQGSGVYIIFSSSYISDLPNIFNIQHVGARAHMVVGDIFMNLYLSSRKKRLNFEYMHENRLRGFQPGLTQTRLYSHRIWLDAGDFRFRK